jgi:hypothetical protein
MGRHSTFDEDTASRICELIADGRSLKSICQDDGMPDKSTVFRWLSSNEAFRDNYTRAREAQADAIFDEILDIADEDQTTVKATGESGEIVTFDSVAVQRNRLRIDARKWMAGKLRPKKYGDKIEIAGDAENPLKIETITRRIIDPTNEP